MIIDGLGGQDREGWTQCTKDRQKGNFMERTWPVDYGYDDGDAMKAVHYVCVGL